jgi:hypothetical protein
MQLEFSPKQTEFFIDNPCNGRLIISREGMNDFGFIQFVAAWGRGVACELENRAIQKCVESLIKIGQSKAFFLHMVIWKHHCGCIEDISIHFMPLGSNRDILIP